MPIRERYNKIDTDIDSKIQSDAHKRFILGAVKVFNFVDNSDQTLSRKKQYVRVLVDSLEPYELLYLLSCIFVSFPKVRRRLRKYSPALSIRKDSFISGFVHDYFCKHGRSE
ncbi:hypothetical protein D3C84_1072780 [compost metagenome]